MDVASRMLWHCYPSFEVRHMMQYDTHRAEPARQHLRLQTLGTLPINQTPIILLLNSMPVQCNKRCLRHARPDIGWHLSVQVNVGRAAGASLSCWHCMALKKQTTPCGMADTHSIADVRESDRCNLTFQARCHPDTVAAL
eukprot:3368974-Amphidinium_carterae.4